MKNFDELMDGIKARNRENAAECEVLRAMVFGMANRIVSEAKIRSPRKAVILAIQLWQMALDCRWLSHDCNLGARKQLDPGLFYEIVSSSDLVNAHIKAMPEAVRRALAYMAKSMKEALDEEGIDAQSSSLLDFAIHAFFAGEMEFQAERFAKLWQERKLGKAPGFKSSCEATPN